MSHCALITFYMVVQMSHVTKQQISTLWSASAGCNVLNKETAEPSLQNFSLQLQAVGLATVLEMSNPCQAPWL